MKKKISADQDLSHMNNRDVLVYSRSVAGMTNAQVALGLGLGEETVARYQREPHPGEHAYDLSIGRIAAWCRITGNYVIPQWIAQQCGGVFVRVDRECPADMSITAQIRRVNKEAGDVVSTLLDDLNGDGRIDDADRRELVKELRELLTAVESALMVADKSGARA